VGLYTGARVREVCQLNPQADIREEDGIWFFDITEDGEAAEGVTKSTKTASSRRRVVIHSRLLELGFLDYLAVIKTQGARQLFPQWQPKAGDAAGHAAEWFREFIRDVGLRDETPGAMVTGFHAFRHTMLTRAKHLRIEERALITGHADGKVSRAQAGYERDGLPLADLRDLIERVSFEVSPPVIRNAGPL
jgi:integrase